MKLGLPKFLGGQSAPENSDIELSRDQYDGLAIGVKTRTIVSLQGAYGQVLATTTKDGLIVDAQGRLVTEKNVKAASADKGVSVATKAPISTSANGNGTGPSLNGNDDSGAGKVLVPRSSLSPIIAALNDFFQGSMNASLSASADIDGIDLEMTREQATQRIFAKLGISNTELRSLGAKFDAHSGTSKWTVPADTLRKYVPEFDKVQDVEELKETLLATIDDDNLDKSVLQASRWVRHDDGSLVIYSVANSIQPDIIFKPEDVKSVKIEPIILLTLPQEAAEKVFRAIEPSKPKDIAQEARTPVDKEVPPIQTETPATPVPLPIEVAEAPAPIRPEPTPAPVPTATQAEPIVATVSFTAKQLAALKEIPTARAILAEAMGEATGVTHAVPNLKSPAIQPARPALSTSDTAKGAFRHQFGVEPSYNKGTVGGEASYTLTVKDEKTYQDLQAKGLTKDNFPNIIIQPKTVNQWELEAADFETIKVTHGPGRPDEWAARQQTVGNLQGLMVGEKIDEKKPLFAKATITNQSGKYIVRGFDGKAKPSDAFSALGIDDKIKTQQITSYTITIPEQDMIAAGIQPTAPAMAVG